jgi:amino acid adenylation domain-containing protein
LASVFTNSVRGEIFSMTDTTTLNSGSVLECLSESGDTYELSNLTKNQLLLWIEQRLMPGVPIYNNPFIFRFAGDIDPEHFQRAFQALVDSSDALRTVFHEESGVPRQGVILEFPYKVEIVDLSKESIPSDALQSWVRRRSAVPSDLEKCLFASALLKVSEKEFAWYFNLHHLIADGWSMSIIYRRLAELYERSVMGKLREAGFGYPSFQDYVKYEREYRHSSECLKAGAYWKEKLSKSYEPLRFYGRPSSKRVEHCERVSCNLGPERTRQLRSIAAQKEIAAITLELSVFNVFAALLIAYLYRISGNRNLAIGTPFHNRISETFRETIGLLMEVAPLQVEISEGETFVSLIKKVKSESYAALRHYQYAPGNPLHNRAYEVLLNYHNSAYPKFNGMPVKLEWIQVGGGANGSLVLNVFDFTATGEFTIDFNFNCDVFDEAQRARVIQHFLRLIDSFLADRNQSIDSLRLLSLEEKELIAEWNRTEVDYPKDRCLHQLFEAQAERTPDAVALVFEGSQLTYRELNEHANQLAHHLQKLGAGPDVLVGLCLERSLEMVVALLGILKSGGAYVPLDPAFPSARLSLILEDSQVKVMVTQRKLMSVLPAYPGKMIYLDAPEIVLESKENLESIVKPNNLAYVIFTSGSTGKPKGVQIENRAVVNFLTTMEREPGLTTEDVLLALTTLSFDIAGLEIFLPLIKGAKVVVAGQEVVVDGRNLGELIETSGATVMQATPATWRMLLETGWEGRKGLKILCGGEEMKPELARELLPRCSSLWNMYGPTETTIWSMIWPVTSTDGSISIGWPIGNTRVYVLDQFLQPVPIGVAGELFIGGDGLARGYFNRPELTAAKFIPDPFSITSGARLYKTGDLTRYLPDGNIEYLGRLDHQVKIRGHRIELGEIEAVLQQHGAVQEAVVIAREDTPGDKRLVAYVALEENVGISERDLRGYLRKKFPEYMVPSAFVFLDVFPLTPNGKLDRKALPAPQNVGQSELCLLPRNETERTIGAIWQQVLHLEKVGIEDNFFDLGGHSLLLVQVHNKLERVLNKQILMMDLFRFPTISSLAEYLSQKEKARAPLVESQVLMQRVQDGQKRLKERLTLRRP